MPSPRRTAAALAVLAFLPSALRCHGSECAVTLIDGSRHADSFEVRLRITGKLAVRQVQLGLYSGRSRASALQCEEANVLFYPGGTYSLLCSVARKHSASTAVRLESALLSDGSVWKGSRSQTCGSVDIAGKRNGR